MASNSLPTNSSQLIGLGTKMLAGLTSLGTSLAITQITPAEFQGQLNMFVTGGGDFNAKRSARQTASDAFQAADTTLSDWLQVTRNVLAARFGSRWSTEWAQAGFIAPSTAVPSRIEERLGLTLNLANFFTANPSYEVASMNVTAAKATALRNAAVNTQQTLTTAKVALDDSSIVFASYYDSLTSEMRSLISILAATLNDDDPRWLAFGLQKPASNATPGEPVSVMATLDERGAIIVQCDPVPLATRYRWRMRLLGIETDYRLVARSTAPMGVITGAMAGAQAQIIVQAVNGGLQGVASEPIVFAMPPVAVAEQAEARLTETRLQPATFVAPKLDEVGIAANSNGITSNGHADGSRIPARV